MAQEGSGYISGGDSSSLKTVRAEP